MFDLDKAKRNNSKDFQKISTFLLKDIRPENQEKSEMQF